MTKYRVVLNSGREYILHAISFEKTDNHQFMDFVAGTESDPVIVGRFSIHSIEAIVMEATDGNS